MAPRSPAWTARMISSRHRSHLRGRHVEQGWPLVRVNKSDSTVRARLLRFVQDSVDSAGAEADEGGGETIRFQWPHRAVLRYDCGLLRKEDGEGQDQPPSNGGFHRDFAPETARSAIITVSRTLLSTKCGRTYSDWLPGKSGCGALSRRKATLPTTGQHVFANMNLCGQS